ncbi:protein NLRC5-like [Sardina pilchardus]|uniref:protein NLRC5-like n=1 Tax=Sardina pilchardus TaxID=27697 RepID=UPI002E0D755F
MACVCDSSSKSLVLVMVLLLQCSTISSSGLFQVIGSDQPLYAVSGEDLVLPCSIKPNLSIEGMTVEWVRLNQQPSLVHLYKDGKDQHPSRQIQSYFNRTSLFKDDLKMGNASLKLRSVQMSDEGDYKCFIQAGPDYDDALIQVIVRDDVYTQHWKIPVAFVLSVIIISLIVGIVVIFYKVRKRRRLWKQVKTKDETDNFHLEKYPDQGLKKMLPVVKASKRVWLNQCHLSEASCEMIASVLQRSTTLDELDMSKSKVDNKGLEKLFEGLRNPNCQLKTLRLAACNLSAMFSGIVAPVLQSPNSLKKLDLSENNLGDAGVQLLSECLSSPHCKLWLLRLNQCHLSKASCVMIASVLQRRTTLRELDMSDNKLEDEGLQELCVGLRDPTCQLETLRLATCNLSEKSCGTVAAVLQSPNSLVELDLSFNDLRDSGVQLLSEGLCNPHSKLQTLRLCNCGISDEGHVCLALTLMLNPSCVKELDVSNNHPGESAQKLLSATLEDPHRKVETIQLNQCHLSKASCKMIASVLQRTTTLRKLDMSDKLEDEELLELCVGLRDSKCQLETLRLADCNLLDLSCGIVATVLQSPNSLIELDLSHNDLSDCGVLFLSKGLSSPHSKLQTLRLCNCCISNGGYVYLALALMLNPSCVKELDVRNNIAGESAQNLLSATLEDPHRNVETLQLNQCHLSKASCEMIASVLQRTSTLRELDMSNNNLEDEGLQDLCVGLIDPECQLETLRLAGCNLSDWSCNTVATLLKSPNSLIELDLSHNDLGSRGIPFLALGLGSPHSKLQTLRLNQCLSKVSCEMITALLQRTITLRELDMSNNKLEGEVLQKLSVTLRDPQCQLETLRLANCNLSDWSCGIVAAVLQSPNTLIELDLSDNDLGDGGVTFLSKGLCSPNNKLQTLRLCKCGISDDGYVCLALALMLNPSCVKELDINNNNPGESAQKLLSATLEDPHHEVEAIQLNQCHLSKASCKFIASVLQKTTTLKELYMNGSKLEDEGLKQLCVGLRDPKCQLETLRLADSNLSERSCSILADVLQSPNSLIELDLSHNDLKGCGVPFLSKGLCSPHSKLQTLRLCDCGISDDGYVCLALALMLNPSCVKELDMSNNNPGESAQKLLSATLKDPHRKIEALQLNLFQLSKASCVMIASVLQTITTLKELDMSNNKLEDEGLLEISVGLLEDPKCQLETLRLADCNLSDWPCEIVADILQSPNSLIELDLSHNDLKGCGVPFLSKGLCSPHSKLQTLRLCDCGISDDGYVCLALALMINPSCVKELDMSNNNPGESAYKLLSATLEDPYRKVEALQLNQYHLSKTSCKMFASLLQRTTSLKVLDMSNNKVEDEGLGELSVGLQDPNCQLETLRLKQCHLSKAICAMFASVLQRTTTLRELDMSNNNLDDEGLQDLSVGLTGSTCQLETLRLADCNLSEWSCSTLADVLQSPNSLIELDLSHNDLKGCGVPFLSKGLCSPHSKLQTLRLCKCGISDDGYVCLALALMLNPTCVKELDMSNNNPGESAQKLLSDTLEDPHCKVEALQLNQCHLSKASCVMIASVLQRTTTLRELDMSDNKLGDEGLQELCLGLRDPKCQLETLRLSNCGISDEGYVCLALTLMLNPSCMEELDVSNNHPGESAQKLLSATLEDPHRKVEALQFADYKLTFKSCEIVASVLRSPNSLLELDLSNNDLGDSGVELFSKGLSSSNCKLQTLRLADCLISKKGCGYLASALTSNPYHLKELDVSYNYPGESGQGKLSARQKDPDSKLKILKTDPASVSKARPRLLRYACELTLDPNIAHMNLSLTEGNRKVTWAKENQQYPEHPERFDGWPQVLCTESLSRHCYWEVEWSGSKVVVAVAYKSIKRKGNGIDCRLGYNSKSWSLECFPDSYSASHINKHTAIPAPSSGSRRVGVYLDWPAGTLSFYSVSSHTLTHLHTFRSTFTEPLYPGFLVTSPRSSVSLCQIT